ncbi:MAG: hypothetical protein LBG27_10480 [Spirochaetaceae bacterium]|nr:hypothetical protein [Spirochaetaceae bacterium]
MISGGKLSLKLETPSGANAAVSDWLSTGGKDLFGDDTVTAVGSANVVMIRSFRLSRGGSISRRSVHNGGTQMSEIFYV